MCTRPCRAASLYCRCSAWCWLSATSWTEVTALEGRPTASPWTFCQNWRTSRAAWVCITGSRRTRQERNSLIKCYSWANRLEMYVYVWDREWSLHNLSVLSEIWLHSVNDMQGEKSSDCKYWFSFTVVLSMSRTECPRFERDTSAKHEDQRRSNSVYCSYSIS